MEINNRKAKFNYFIEDTYEAGIALVGTEIKSLRLGNANINESYAIIRNNEVFLINMFVDLYKEGNIFNHEETRMRKLLLHKPEIKKISNKMMIEGYTIVPLKVYIKNGLVKVLIGLGKGKKNYDKRETIKERDQKREIDRNFKQRNS